MDRPTYMMKLKGAFREYENAHKNIAVTYRSFGPVNFAPLCCHTTSHEIIRASGVRVYGFLQGIEERTRSPVPSARPVEEIFSTLLRDR